MSARTILKHVYENGGMTEYQYERIDRVLKERERPHGEWILLKQGGVFCKNCKFTIPFRGSKPKYSFCPNCGASMISSNSEIEKSKSEIENSNLPERFTATDCSCLNCKNRHSVHCEPQNKKIYGYCGNWERR